MADSSFDPKQLSQARALLAPPVPAQGGVVGLAAAAGLFALSALALAVTVVLAPAPWALK